MYLPLGTYSPEIKLGLVSASRNCFPRKLSEERTVRLIEGCNHAGIKPSLSHKANVALSKLKIMPRGRKTVQTGRVRCRCVLSR